MENSLWSDILMQRSNLPSVVRHLSTTERESIDEAAAFIRNDRPIALIGVASAAYACMPAEAYLGRRGRYASVMCASEALYSTPQRLAAANVVINSRSGETVEVVKLGRYLRDHDIPFVAITNEPESTLATLATHVIRARTHKDDLVSINVVTGMMTATLALAAAVAGELDDLQPHFEHLAAAMSQCVDTSAAHGSQMLDVFADVRPVHLLYRGGFRGSAYCGRLVLEEVARTPGVTLGAAEFRQGPNEVIDGRFGAVVFVGDGEQGDLNRALCREIADCGGRVMAITADTSSGFAADDRTMVVRLPRVQEFLMPVLAVVPLQVLAYRLAEAQGYSPGAVQFISKVIVREAGIPNGR